MSDDFKEEGYPQRRELWMTLGIVVLVMLIVLVGLMAYSHLPRAGGNSNDALTALTPTPAQSNPIASIELNRSFSYSGVNLTVTRVGEAGSYSDDQKHQGKYVVRVYLEVQNPGESPVGIDYQALARLVLPDGTQIAPQLITIPPVVLPGQKQTGYLDFPVNQQLDLSTLSLHLGKKAQVLFS
ncbi:hypothetical protein [Thermogemmatispora sp.]|uniref:hypothetical protein n=1 Tax=Thermogemmatispora sp. TaxID=1968838 RepID=UPI001D945856|nr:hypothetical protein [Thermogemmatispora sp.]MBX5451092.1 hypothetical protein [Thermogemmatispora sp.]